MVAIFVILTIVAFIVADSLVQQAEARKERQVREPAILPVGSLRPAFAFAGVSVPKGIFVDAGHTWIDLDASGRAHVGMDDFAQKAIGHIDAVELPEEGQEIRRGERLFTIRQGQRTAVFTAPIDGEITSVNETLGRHPGAIKADPYEQGWVCALNPKNLARNLRQLSIAEEAMAWLNEEVRKFQDFISARLLANVALGPVLQDGGQLTDGVLELMDDDTWRLFTDEFLTRSN